MKQAAIVTILFFTSVLVCLCGCKKDSFITSYDAPVLLSADTLRFDTVFTSTGSVTQFFKISNGSSQKLKISSISLHGAAASVFKINADGFAGPVVKNIDLDAGDSLFVFVNVSINPTAANLPFIMRDSISIETNGHTRYVQLEAWGQNAHFLRNQKITANTVWPNDLPYVILGGLQVDTAATLSIQKGGRIYMHADAPIIVDGTLLVNGEKYDSTRVYFSSDRLDYPYNEYPAGWPGIYFRGNSKNNVLQYAVVRNAYQGLVAQQPSINGNPKLQLNACIIDNIYDAGLYGLQTSIIANNCLISNCGKNVQLVYGGNYQFTNCTVPTIGSSYITHKDPALYISNSVLSGGTLLTAALTASFNNCLIWSENSTADNEVVVARQGTGTFNVVFNNCLWKVKTNPSDITSGNIIANQDPQFDSVNASRNYYNFRLKSSSPAIDKGAVVALPTDLDGNPRTVRITDIGAFEKQ